MFFIGILLPYNDPNLLGGSAQAASSPLTIALTNAGILPAAHLINALIVISVISAGNGSLYVASRTLLFMSRSGKAPKFIGRTNAAGVPWVALICSNMFSCIVFLSLSSSAGRIYSALITLSGGKIHVFLLSRLTPVLIIHVISRNLHCMGDYWNRTYPIPKGPRCSRPGSRNSSIQGNLVPVGNVFRHRCKYIPRLLPRLHSIPGPVQCNRLRDQLYPATRVSAFPFGIQILEQDTAGEIGGDGYLDWEERASRSGIGG